MGVVQGPDGRFYEIPDEILQQYAVPNEKVKELLREESSAPASEPQAAAPPPPNGPPPGMPIGGPGGPGGPVVIQVFTSGPPPGAEPQTVAQDGWGAWRQQPGGYAQPTYQIVIPPWGYHQPPQPPEE